MRTAARALPIRLAASRSSSQPGPATLARNAYHQPGLHPSEPAADQLDNVVEHVPHRRNYAVANHRLIFGYVHSIR
jgi:hypothetical protein